MTKPLLFRAWDGSEMTYITDLYWFEENGVHDGQGDDGLPSSYQLMQYIGLNDTNNNPIYEGDIVRFLTFGGLGIVTYAAPSFIAGKYSLQGREVFVIGNIYENPDMAEVTMGIDNNQSQSLGTGDFLKR